MKGSGLSLERFIQGKAQRTKAEAKSKKKVIIRKAVRKREYEKVKRHVEAKHGATNDGDDHEAGPSSFYDRFFGKLQGNDHDYNDKQARGGAGGKGKGKDRQVHMEVKPDPFFKAKKKADVQRREKQRVHEEKAQRRVETEKKIQERKKRHVKLSVRTATGQPVVRNHIKDILAKLESEKRQGRL